jgi:hypothetical protein
MDQKPRRRKREREILKGVCTELTRSSGKSLKINSLDGGSAHRKATTYTGQHNTEKRGHTFMPRARFESTIPVFERVKTMRALDRAAIGTGRKELKTPNFHQMLHTIWRG